MTISLSELTSRIIIKNLLKQSDIRLSKRLGQNFLISRAVLSKIIKAADLKSSDTVLEIGAGIGTLTQELAKKAKKVIAIEKDERMMEILGQTLKTFNNIEIIKEDILKISSSRLQVPNFYKIVANLPYYITSPVIKKFLESENPPEEMVLMVQKEVAQRICAISPRMSVLAVSVQFYSSPKIVSYVSKSCFWPKPKVDSAIIKLTLKNQRLEIDKDLFFKIVKAGFSHPRKQLVNNLAKKLAPTLSNNVKLEKEKVRLWLLKNKIDPTQRAQTLTLKDWQSLTKTFI